MASILRWMRLPFSEKVTAAVSVSYLREIEDLLHEHHAELVRTKKHRIWKFPDGRIWVVAGSPRSDSAWKTNLHDLKKFLGISVAAKTNTERRVKKGTTRKVKWEPVPLRQGNAIGDFLNEWKAKLPSLTLPPQAKPYAAIRRFETTPLKWILFRIFG